MLTTATKTELFTMLNLFDSLVNLTDELPALQWVENLKVESTKVAKALRVAGYPKLATRIAASFQYLYINLRDIENGGDNPKFAVNSCSNSKFDPIYKKLRSMLFYGRFISAAAVIAQERPRARWVALTLTVRNCQVSELKSTIAHMNKSWDRLRKRRNFPALGYIKSLEVTREGDTDYAHPHFHILMLVEPKYFSGDNYIKQADWRQMWQQSLKVDYLPQVHVKAADKGNPDTVEAVGNAVAECMKYTVKGDKHGQDPQWLKHLVGQLHYVRTIAIGGILRKHFKEEDFEFSEPEYSNTEKTPELRILCGFVDDVKRYRTLRTPKENMSVA